MSDQKKNWQEIADKDEDVVEETVEEENQETPQIEHPDYQSLEKKLTEAEAKAHENWDKFMRAQADLDNVRRRMERELEKAHKYALENFVKALLPVVDSLENGISACEKADDPSKTVIDGMQMTLKLFLDTLKKFEVIQIDPLGEPFDPTHHEAMATQENPDMEPNQVMQVLQKGYLLNGRLVRPALVIITKT